MYRLPKIFIAILLLFAIFSTSVISTRPPTVDPIKAFINNNLPKTTPGSAGSWTLENAMPNMDIRSPIQIANIPEGDDFFLINKWGEVHKISLTNQTQELVLDMKEETFIAGDAGLTGIALHPSFGDESAPDKQQVFIYYHTKPNASVWALEGFNRLSKFTWDEQSQTFDKSSEEILIQQYDRDYLHNGGRMFFGSDGFLHISVGDEGGRNDATLDQIIMLQESSTQRINKGFFSGILRIDVDNDLTRSHPIRRQPLSDTAPPSGWGNTYSQGYSIPNDNPWLSTDSSHLEEFYAIGLRSPYSMHYDEQQDQIWVGDVGTDIREEINKVNKKDNLQWPYMEGSVPSNNHEKPADFIGNEKGVFYEIERADGQCILGAGIYRGDTFPELYGKYIYADYNFNKIVTLTNIQGSTEPTTEAILNELRGQNVELPEEFAITGIHLQPNGEILVMVTALDSNALGLLLRLKSKEFVPDPVSKLSELGVFADLENLIPIDGIIPYKVNSPLWSDGAIKKRWMAIPNDGSFDTDEEKVKFSSNGEWIFPKGTVFIKHFELPATASPNGEVIKLETRFFVIGEDNIGYGLTYKWDEDGKDATLIGGGSDAEHFDVYDVNNNLFTQTWNYPGRDQCIACHNQNAGYVLGVNTHQLNGSLFYPNSGTTYNQLEYLNELDLFDKNISDPDNYPRSVAIDDEDADLDTRVRSYLDSNCASCHRIGGLARLTLDLRFNVPLRFTSTVNHVPRSEVSNVSGFIVKPGDHAASELWIRDASEETKRMPPIGREIVDEVYIEALAEWIDNLPEDAGSIKDLYLRPNPTLGWLYTNIHEDWTGPFQISIINSSGKTLQSFEVDSYYPEIDLSKLVAGVYFIEVSSTEERIIKKFVKL